METSELLMEKLRRLPRNEGILNSGDLTTAVQNETERFKLALDLADAQYHHAECEAVGAKSEQRSFCFQHGQVTSHSFLLIHGFTACPYEMRELGQRLFEQGANVFGVRLSGHGTQVADFARYNRKDWQNAAETGLAIAALLGREVVVIGESMGGAIAALLAKKYPSLIQKLILCAPCFYIANPLAEFTTIPLVRWLIPNNDMGVAFDWQRDYWYSTIPTSRVAELVQVAREARVTGADITMPTLIIQAENDKIVQPSGAARYFNSLSQLTLANKKLQRFANGHHNLTIDLNPQKQQVFDWIFEFVG